MNLSQFRSNLAGRFTQPAARLLSKAGISPNALSVCGFELNLAAGAAIATGHLVWGGLLVLFSGLFDLMDGALARASGRTTSFGALLDSTLDRLSEAAVLLGLLILYLGQPSALGLLLVYLTFVGSVLVSYVKARGEGLGLECNVGLFTRPERVVLLAAGLLTGQVIIALVVVALLSYFTAVQRLVYLSRQTVKDMGQGARLTDNRQ